MSIEPWFYVFYFTLGIAIALTIRAFAGPRDIGWWSVTVIGWLPILLCVIVVVSTHFIVLGINKLERLKF